VKFTEEEELAFEALAEESRVRRLTPQQREEEEMQKRKEEEEDLMSSGDDDDDDYTDEEQAAEWIDAHEDFKRVASEEARGEVLSEERGGGEGLHDDVKKEGGDVRLYTKRVEEERKRLREVYHMKRVEEREAMRKEKRYDAAQRHTTQHHAVSCHAMPCHAMPCHGQMYGSST
jgi:hypothetical protein